jgi:N-acetylglutamate synthase-like GNAT family acetyltransferase
MAEATPADAGAIRQLLEEAHLPTDDLAEACRRHFLVLRENDTLIGAVAIDLLGTVALLRSLVVADAARRRGMGKESDRGCRSAG